MEDQYELDGAIRKVPDFPKPGILFYDVTSILMNPDVFQRCIAHLASLATPLKPDAVAAVEARGFIFGAPLAIELGVPLVLIRKKGKLPGKTVRKTFTLEYGEDEIEVHRDDVRAKQRIVIVDDLVATGGTLRAAADILAHMGAFVPAVLCVIGLPFLRFRDVMGDIPVETLIEYDSE